MGLIRNTRSILKYTLIFLYGVHFGSKCSSDKKYTENIKDKISNEQKYNSLEDKINK